MILRKTNVDLIQSEIFDLLIVPDILKSLNFVEGHFVWETLLFIK